MILNDIDKNETVQALIKKVKTVQFTMGVDQGSSLASSVCLFFNGTELKLAQTLVE
jgi:hypothetical protein